MRCRTASVFLTICPGWTTPKGSRARPAYWCGASRAGPRVLSGDEQLQRSPMGDKAPRRERGCDKWRDDYGGATPVPRPRVSQWPLYSTGDGTCQRDLP
jgi:hypothetical protein